MNIINNKRKDFFYNQSKSFDNILYLISFLNIIFIFQDYFTPDTNKSIIFFHYYTLVSSGIFILLFLQRALGAYSFFKFLRASAIDIIAIIVVFLLSFDTKFFMVYVLGRQLFILGRLFTTESYQGNIYRKLSHNPSGFFLLSFLFTIFLGTFLLMLPVATTLNKVTPFIDAFFTSTSATCVTGLSVLDTGTYFSLFGQLVILMLIQIGGLGIMTISTAFAILLGQRMTLRSQNLMQNVTGESSRIDMINLIKNIVLVTIIIEAIGAILFYFSAHNFYESTREAIYSSVFHSVSAFCNAGFSLNNNSFESYSGNLSINFILMFLILLGGIGFSVLVDIKRNVIQKTNISRLSLHTKIVIITSLSLILIGFFGYFISEYDHTMKDFSFNQKLLSSLFQSVTTRTAGFNTINNADLSKSSLLLTLILMFIGASPGSTGGGIKTTTFAVSILSVLSIIQGGKEISIFRKKISKEKSNRVMALIAISVGILMLMIYLLFLFQPGSFQSIIFEAISAYGTVGLSMGFTSKLTSIGKIIIILLMYLGRVGPLTFIFALSETKSKNYLNYTEGKISIG